MRVSRRTVLALGGSMIALLSGTALWKARSGQSTTLPHASQRAMEPVVDHNGWILTAADKRKILESEPAAPPASPPDADADTDRDAP